MNRYDRNLANKNGGIADNALSGRYGQAFYGGVYGASSGGFSIRGEMSETRKSVSQEYNKRGERVGLYSSTIHKGNDQTFGRRGGNIIRRFK